VLTDTSGNARPDNTYSFVFNLYDSTGVGIPIWTETKTLQTKKGLFSMTLGDVTPFAASMKFDKQYYLGIRVGTEAELAPLIPLTSVAYSMNALRADTARVSLGAQLEGEAKLRNLTSSRTLSLFAGTATLDNWISSYDQDGSLVWIMNLADRDYTNMFGPFSGEKQNYVFTVRPSGNVGVGINSPQGKLDVFSGTASSLDALFVRSSPSVVDQGGIIHHQSAEYAWQEVAQGTGSLGGSLQFHYVKRSDPAIKIKEDVLVLNSDGKVSVSVLEIRGGSDLAEPFEISNAETVEPGSVVIIDEDHPGKLKLSYELYDKRVAGVVSGAGGIKPGLTLKEEGVIEGNQNIALSGRV
jgi:hypothetical protein